MLKGGIGEPHAGDKNKRQCQGGEGKAPVTTRGLSRSSLRVHHHLTIQGLESKSDDLNQ